jgi:hypothetical protein
MYMFWQNITSAEGVFTPEVVEPTKPGLRYVVLKSKYMFSDKGNCSSYKNWYTS